MPIYWQCSRKYCVTAFSTVVVYAAAAAAAAACIRGDSLNEEDLNTYFLCSLSLSPACNSLTRITRLEATIKMQKISSFLSVIGKIKNKPVEHIVYS